jgi:hypothetical protein
VCFKRSYFNLISIFLTQLFISQTSLIGGGGARQSVEMAETLFDNESEWPDELPFARGDRLRVLERRADGWWMCEDASRRRGIAPANRLRLLPPMTTATVSKSTKNSSCE